MNKVFKTLMVVGLMVAIATPALAEFKLNGYFRTMMYSRELKGATKEGTSQQFVLNRFRGKMTYSLNDNVALVYYGEVDTDWGVPRSANLRASSTTGHATDLVGVGGGGQVGADGINIETKNVYLDLKAGDTKARLGVQGWKDAYQGIVAFDDMAALTVSHNFGAASVNAIYSKWQENDKSLTDDLDLYGLGGSFKLSDNAKLGADVYVLNDKQGPQGAMPYVIGVNGDFRFADFAIAPFIAYAAGEDDDLNQDFNGLAASVKGSMVIPNGDVNLRVLYFASNDEDNELNYWGEYGFQGAYAFAGENSMFFLVDKFVTNAGKERYAITDAVRAGYGLLGFQFSGNHKLPNAMYANWGAGYWMADKKDPKGAAAKPGDKLGYEVAVRVGKKVYEKVDISLNAAYAGFGDFYDGSASGDDPDGIYKAYAMVNVPF